jgi:hypothetical protein
MVDLLDAHYKVVIQRIIDGRVIPFLGAGANLCDRPTDSDFVPGQHLPSSGELASYLAEKYGAAPGVNGIRCPLCKSEGHLSSDDDDAVTRRFKQCPLCNAEIQAEAQDLARVSQQIAMLSGSGPLYDGLRKLLSVDYPPTLLHRFLAALPNMLRDRGGLHPYQLIVTTNYDDALERAFNEAGEPFDLVYYVADDKQRRGKFWHLPPDGEPRLILRPNTYRRTSTERRTVILKIHGSIDRKNAERDSFVITEDHYIDYLTRTELSTLIPAKLLGKLRTSHFLFLGHSLRDWNLRVMLYRIWGEQNRTYKSWAIQRHPDPVEMVSWRKRDVDIFDMSIEDYVEDLRERLESLSRTEI